MGGSHEFDPDILGQSVMAVYLKTNVSLFRCTADFRIGACEGSRIPSPGVIPASRTVSMNRAVGTACDAYFQTGLLTTAPNPYTR